MAYTVLARKYRSWTFDELVGQEAVATTLKNAINSGRIHHGYLFCGTRGVGKTSAARILARSLNCLASDAPTVDPCRKCESCVSIAEGQDIDVIEIDAASHTGVDNIRELRGNTIYRPARSRFKVYIIDEVHMLSTGAFNALLKTLEEPPEHVKFILATTEPQKVPATIHSRCQRYDFRTISMEKIAAHFEWILTQEKISAETGAVRRIARLANGSMRDGLSLLDQLLAMGGDKLTVEMIDDVLPTPHDETLHRLIEQLANHDAAGALALLDGCLAAGYSLERLAESLAEQIRTLMLLTICGRETTLVDLPASVLDSMATLSGRFEPESYVYMIAVFEELRRNVRFSALGRPLLEAAIVRLASAVPYRSIQTLLDELGGGSISDGSAERVQPKPAAPRVQSPAQPIRSPAAETKPRSRGSSAPASRPSVDPSAGSESKTPPTSVSAGNNARPKKSVSKEDVAKARSEPVVQQAMDLFGGTLVNVERVDGNPESVDESGEDNESVDEDNI